MRCGGLYDFSAVIQPVAPWQNSDHGRFPRNGHCGECFSTTIASYFRENFPDLLHLRRIGLSRSQTAVCLSWFVEICHVSFTPVIARPPEYLSSFKSASAA